MVVPAGLTALEPQQDKGNQAEAARVAAAIIQARPELVGIAGFDSESGPGMGQALREAGKAGTVVATCVETEEQHLRLLKEGVLTACIGGILWWTAWRIELAIAASRRRPAASGAEAGGRRMSP